MVQYEYDYLQVTDAIRFKQKNNSMFFCVRHPKSYKLKNINNFYLACYKGYFHHRREQGWKHPQLAMVMNRKQVTLMPICYKNLNYFQWKSS